MAVVLVVIVVIAVGTLSQGAPVGDPGRTSEPTMPWTPADGTPPTLVDATDAWGLAAWRHHGTIPASGGVAIDDIDDDGAPDLVLAAGERTIMFGGPSGFSELQLPGDAVATAVGTADVDRDGHVDLLFGTATGDDEIWWGGDWLSQRDPERATVTTLAGGEPTSGLLSAELSGDDRPDVLRLTYGPASDGAPDLIWHQRAAREFEPVELPGASLSLAAEIADVDGDDLADIWVTRDLGWAKGADSVYSRRGDADGAWHDVAAALGLDLEIDGMGLTVTDLDGDGDLDGYLSDLGDNEVLTSEVGGFRRHFETGAARIRPPDAGVAVISSSWASGAADLNLDGEVDLIVANGGFPTTEVVNKVRDTDVALDDPPAILLGRGDGTFSEVWPELGLDWSGASRGMAIGDIDRDGDSDIVIVNHGGGLVALRNDTSGPSRTLRARPGCDTAGVVATSGRHTALIRAHSFLGAHAPEVIFGGVGPITVSAEMTAVDNESPERTTMILDC